MNFHRASPRLTTLTAPTIGLLISCMLLAGCGTGGDTAVSPEHSAEAEATPALPHGVQPPNDPPQPGDARLSPDGYYDYSAPDFELKNPCDMDIYQRALEKGWRPPDFGKQRRDYDDVASCGIVSTTNGIAISNSRHGRQFYEQMGRDVQDRQSGEYSWYTVIAPGLTGDVCVATADSSSGSLGLTTGIGGFSDLKTAPEACDFISATYEDLFKGD